MLKKFLLFTIASLVMLPALADKPPDKPDKGNKGGGAVPLGVVFRDDYHYINEGTTLVRDDKFGSDGFAQTSPETQDVEYIDGEEQVETQIDKFRFGLNVGRNGERNFFLDLSRSQCRSDPESDCVATSPYFRGVNVFATSPGGAQYLKMKVGDAPKPVNFSLLFFDNLDQEWSIKFNSSECPGVDPDDMVTVTKTSDAPLDTWEFEATEDMRACLYFREGPRKNHEFAGLYSVPFLITAQVIE